MPRRGKTTLTPPVSERDHSTGDARAPVTLVEYGDFECPSCGRAYPILKAIQERFGPQLRFVFRNFPIPTNHRHALHAAEAAEAASAAGRFWEMHDRLFEHQDALEDEDLASYAEAVGLDRHQFARDLASGKYAATVREHVASGERSGVRGTPTLFLNGARYEQPWDEATLTGAIEALGAAPQNRRRAGRH